MKSEEVQIKRAMEQLGQKINDPNFQTFLNSVFKDVLQGGKVPKEALKFTDEKTERMYAEAYRLYNSGKYREASYIFRMLIFLDVTQPRYTMGLAACAHMEKDYDAAIKAYISCSAMDADDPLPLFHASDCYIEKNDPASAILMLEMAVLRAGDRSEYQIMKDRALLTIESLKKELIQPQV